MSKKVLSLVLALVMVLGSFGFVSAANYSDVAGTEFEEAVSRLSKLEVLTGYPDGSFKPEGQITRAEFAAVAVRVKGLANAAKAAEGLPTGFTDVPGHFWASGIVGTAAKAGIVNGVGHGLFAPQAPVKYEEAITMIVRALGYEAAAQAKGGYPYGYLIVANEIGVLDEVKGTQGVPASRGIVAQMTDNALEIAMMIQVGFGQDTKWVVSGSKEHGDDAEERYLLDEMGFDSVKGRVISVNTKTDKLVVDPTKEELKNVTLEVEEGFDFYAVEGLEAKFWSKDDVVIVHAVQEEAKFDAVEYDDDDEVTLVTEDENYEVNEDAKITLDGKSINVKRDLDDFNADYAKVVLNDDDEIIWAEGFTFDGFILVEEVDGKVALSYDDYDEVDLKDFTIVKDGLTIGLEGIEEGDILFFNNDEEFAVVFNKGIEGEIDRAYTNLSFRVDGKTYNVTAIGNEVPLYFDGDKIGELDVDILDDFVDDEVEITTYLDFAGKVVVVSGEVSSIGNSSYAVLVKDAHPYVGRSGAMIALDLRNGAGEKVSYDILEDDVDDGDIKLVGSAIDTLVELKALKSADKEVLKISFDKDGDITKIEQPKKLPGADKFEIDDANVKVSGVSYRLQSNTIVFHDGNKKATTLSSAKGEFEEVIANSTIYVVDGRVVAVVGETDTDTDTEDITGFVKKVRVRTNDKLQLTLNVRGKEETFTTKNDWTLTELEAIFGTLANFQDLEETIITLEVGETTREIEDFKVATPDSGTIAGISGRTITTTNAALTVELNSNAVIYDAQDDFEVLSLRDLKNGMTIDVYYEGTSDRFVDYVVVNGGGTLPSGDQATLEDAFIVRGNTWVTIDGEDYLYGGTDVLPTIPTGGLEITFTTRIIEGDVVVTSINVVTP